MEQGRPQERHNKPQQLHEVWEKVQAEVKLATLKSADFYTPDNGPEGIDDAQWRRDIVMYLKKIGIPSVAHWDTKVKNSAFRFQLIRAVTRGAMYEPLRETLETSSTDETTDLREMVKANFSVIAGQTGGNCSVATALFTLCPKAMTRMKTAIDKQEPWTNLKKRGKGKGSRKRKASADANTVPPHIVGPNGDGEPPPAKTAKVSFFTSETEEDYPNGFKCPITTEIMEDPVHAADGHTYERAAIEDWLIASNKNTSPKTGAVLPHKDLQANFTLKSLIDEYKSKVGRTSGGGSSSCA